MKTFLLCCLLVLTNTLNVAKAQSFFRLYVEGTPYQDGETVYIKCNNNLGGIEATSEYQSNFYNMTVYASDILSSPAGYSFNNINAQSLQFARNTPHDGDFSIVCRDLAHGYTHTFTVHFRTTPVVTFSSLPALNKNQSGTAQVYIDPTFNPYTPYTSVNWSTSYGLRVNNGTSYSSGNTGDYNTQTISATGSGGKIYVSATNACGTSPTVASGAIGPPYIENPLLTLFDSYSNMWQFTQVWHTPSTTYSFYVASGTATLSQNVGDCYITTQSGASVCVTGTNTYGTCDPYCFYVPGGGSYMRSTSPNPAKDRLTVQFTDTKSLESLPTDIVLYSENSTKAVKTVSIDDVYNRKAFEDGDKLSMSVGELPRGIYYIHAVQRPESKLPTQRVRIILE